MSVPAQASGNTLAHRHTDPGVPHPDLIRDPAALVAAAATNPAVSDRAYRVYSLVVMVYSRGVDAATIARILPNHTETQAARLLGDLTSAGLLDVRRRVVGYTAAGSRIRRRFYTLAGVGA